MDCVCIPCPQLTQVVAAAWHRCSISKPSVCWQPLASSVSQSPSHGRPRTASSWLQERGAPQGAPWGSSPRGVPFICCFADVGFGSCLTCINYSTTAQSLAKINFGAAVLSQPGAMAGAMVGLFLLGAALP